MKRSYIYLTWIGTVIGAPILLLFYYLVTQKTDFRYDELGLVFLVLFFGLFFSLPALAVYILLFELVKRKVTNETAMRLFLLCLSISLIGISFRILGGSSATYLAATYTIASVLATAIFWRRLSS